MTLKLPEVYLYYFSDQISKLLEIDLLLFKKHYLIKRFNAFINSRNNLFYFLKKSLQFYKMGRSHKTLCISSKPQKLCISEKKCIKYTDFCKCLYHQYAIHADFEANQKIGHVLPDPSENNSAVLSYTILVINPSDKTLFHEYFIKLNANGQCLDTLKEIFDKLLKKTHFNNTPTEGISYAF